MSDFNLRTFIDTDSYKLSHWKQYPDKTNYMFSYLEARKGGKFSHTVFFGLRYILNNLKVPTAEEVEEGAEFAKAHGVPFNKKGWLRIVELGYYPIKIRAVPEGAIIPENNILMSVESTDPETFWIASWLETQFVRLWYPITVATNSWNIKQMIKGFCDKTSDTPDEDIKFKLHDFGARGVSCAEQALIGGMAHLISFFGSDTILGVLGANKIYGVESGMSGFSISASEHSTMTMHGRDNEVGAYKQMIREYGSDAVFACVSDSYDIYNAVEHIWGGELKEAVEQMDAMLVIRPDSGDPVEVVTKVIKLLDKKFGHQMNSKGYKVLKNVRVIQGDGVDHDSILSILKAITDLGYSSDNVNFGSGGALLQKHNRDTCKFAFKCSYAKVNGKGVDVFKSPATAQWKKSKKGLLDLVPGVKSGTCKTVNGNDGVGGLLTTYYKDGEIIHKDSFDDIRRRANEVPLVQA